MLKETTKIYSKKTEKTKNIDNKKKTKNIEKTKKTSNSVLKRLTIILKGPNRQQNRQD